jgi:hypothetical protein
MNVKLLKMQSGVYVLAELVNVGENGTLTLRNPVELAVVPDPHVPQKANIQFIPFVMFSDENEFYVRREDVLIQTTPEQQFMEGYTRQFGAILPANMGDLAQFQQKSGPRRLS